MALSWCHCFLIDAFLLPNLLLKRTLSRVFILFLDFFFLHIPGMFKLACLFREQSFLLYGLEERLISFGSHLPSPASRSFTLNLFPCRPDWAFWVRFLILPIG